MNFGFYIYLLFIASWFLHLSARLIFLGTVHFDLLLIIIMTLAIFLGKKNDNITREIKLSKVHKVICFFLVYIVVTLPFVEWPGSAIHAGFENYLKAIVFYFFTIYFVTDERKLKLFIGVFLGCQSFRILEPVYLHITQGYWGSFASMSGWEYMDRLSGAPKDVVNPNGLAFIAVTIICFYFFLSQVSRGIKIASFIVIPLSIYALLLTGSRSGMVGLFIVLCAILVKSKNKFLIVLLICIGGVVSFNYLSANFIDRYKSIYDSSAKNAGTAEGRIAGSMSDLRVALKKPFFGFGLGNSREANANYKNVDQLSHNLYTEVAQELGFIGLAIFIFLIKSIFGTFNYINKSIKDIYSGDYYLLALNNAMRVWLYMNVIYSLASYGLSSYEWYFFAGLSVSLITLVKQKQDKERQTLSIPSNC